MHTPPAAPRFIIFEGVDGVGKTTITRALTAYFAEHAPATPVFRASFPGNRPHSLGEWVYQLHHGQTQGTLTVDEIDPIALQLLHVAAHVDVIRSRIAPILADPVGGVVLLDRYWWSTYAYSRPHLSPQQALGMVEPERTFWRTLPSPIAIYLTRRTTLKPDELPSPRHQQLAAYYREIIAVEREAGTTVHEIANDGTFEELWQTLLPLCVGHTATADARSDTV